MIEDRTILKTAIIKSAIMIVTSDSSDPKVPSQTLQKQAKRHECFYRRVINDKLIDVDTNTKSSPELIRFKPIQKKHLCNELPALYRPIKHAIVNKHNKVDVLAPLLLANHSTRRRRGDKPIIDPPIKPITPPTPVSTNNDDSVEVHTQFISKFLLPLLN
ncbi:hypothetical protein RclHR1_12800015 [Rhizophagus clarus]|uniref:Uncharacterized protein n=1 Tax=Rhizophagus clarus TaxID=94130 RepID=A0A2Z6Q892_9GLOM|nr:hypothetical protein RclHR1_12800015 [Rhizophagus clarus]